ncbi:hypothetical protein K450DRAFT_177360 [Umbelopsis ramanniana AG]|uniref:Glycoside hydrolase family 32 protein n=1 Tax=Umbelopsis ramanniana AG TaxID=1314678 RepID=A0AAD5E6P4_UMBRA|nr:uncharacterized protein K450DRAFT_177360 [Umbelopsis ramanniana AG]KAI8577779.1 hypothetical protein K450DRAFT_177360 [Umbelopsis ramanniana AG]
MVPGYNQTRRPQVHFSPAVNFMNDPNGLFYYNGTYHMYYQYNPTGITAGNQHWGHATSDDLYHWHNQPIALSPESPDEGIFSGSAVVDVDNTSGFFGNQSSSNPGIVAIYTLNTPSKETQNIAYSTDGGYTFTKYSGNPVIDINSNQFRDPKVIWHADTKKWVMAVALPTQFSVVFYTSSDLKNWKKASTFSHHGWLGNQFECPNLVEVPVHNSQQQNSGETKWVLVVSVNPGAPQGGSFTQFFPGEFDGTDFTPEDDAARWVDFGKDNYAMQFFYGTENKTLGLGWASNWQYTNIVPTSPWRSAMTLPRQYALWNDPVLSWQFISNPTDMSTIMNKNLFSGKVTKSKNIKLGDGSGAYYFDIYVSQDQGQATQRANFTFISSSTKEELRMGLLMDNGPSFFIDRSGTKGFDYPLFTDKFATIQYGGIGGWHVYGVLDKMILETFLNEGEQSATTTYFSNGVLDKFSISLDTGLSATVNVTALKSGWDQKK